MQKHDVCSNLSSDEIRFTKANNEALQYIMEGRSGAITCTAESYFDITYEWYVGERKITRDGNAGEKYYIHAKCSNKRHTLQNLSRRAWIS